MFSFVHEESQRRIAETLNLTRSLVSRIYRRLQDLCSVDLENRSIVPFGGPGAVIKCDESKFNHKSKVINLTETNPYTTIVSQGNASKKKKNQKGNLEYMSNLRLLPLLSSNQLFRLSFITCKYTERLHPSIALKLLSQYLRHLTGLSRALSFTLIKF